MYIPRVPGTIPQQSTVHIGLGSARNFCSSRNAFQHFIDNVPIAGRAFYEADLDLKKMAKTKENLKKMKGKKSQNNKENQLFQVLGETIRNNKKVAGETMDKERDIYFPESSVALGVTTYMLIPLAQIGRAHV